MSYQARRILTPGPTQKRKERELLEDSTSLKPLVQQKAISLATTSSREGEGESQSTSSNRILAGYMAYEFLTKGTLFGEKFDPAGSKVMTVNTVAESKRNKQIQNKNQPNDNAEPSGKLKPHSYAEVANLLKMDGTHIPGVVNPTQLARWFQM